MYYSMDIQRIETILLKLLARASQVVGIEREQRDPNL